MWAQPWAWLGLAGLAVPIAIHLLARHQAVRAAFPTLRFIDASELNAIKRQRLTDIPLLLVRLLMVALAVAAIAGPRWGAAPVAAGRDVARATVFDTSESARVAAAPAASVAADDQQIQVGTADLGAGIDAAVAWAAQRSGAREIVVRSDFQRGTLTADDVRRVPEGIGLRFERVASDPTQAPVGFSRNGDDARMTWPVSAPAVTTKITVMAGPDQAVAEATLAAALSVTGPIVGSAHGPVTVVFPNAPDRVSLVGRLQPINAPWMFGVVTPLMADGAPEVRIGSIDRGLVVATDAEPSSFEAAELLATIANALNRETPLAESDARTIDDAQLTAWTREPVGSDVQQAGEPQARWLWMAVLALLAIETVMRRRAV